MELKRSSQLRTPKRRPERWTEKVTTGDSQVRRGYGWRWTGCWRLEAPFVGWTTPAVVVAAAAAVDAA